MNKDLRTFLEAAKAAVPDFYVEVNQPLFSTFGMPALDISLSQINIIQVYTGQLGNPYSGIE